MKTPLVCCSPTGNLWLVLDEGVGFALSLPSEVKPCVVMCLETGEVRRMTRPLWQLLQYGWRVVEGERP